MCAINLEAAQEVFEASTDFTVGIEEEFALLDPGSLDLVQRFEELKQAAEADPSLSQSVAGELISSEIEIRSGKGVDFQDACRKQQTVRNRLFELASGRGIFLGAMATHPWSPWQDQHIIDHPHYHRVEQGLKYVAWRNNTFSVHIHVGIKGADRAVAICDRMREVLPELLAISANSAYLDGRISGLHSVRSQIFTRSFPRCGIPQAFGDWHRYAEHVDFLLRTRSLVEHTQLWWSIRPHLSFGTVEVRICDAQSHGDESLAIEALMLACVAQAARDIDEGRIRRPVQRELIEENLWRAIRYGMDGNLIDLPNPVERTTAAAVEGLLEWVAPMRRELGLDGHLSRIESMVTQGNGAQRQIARHREGAAMREVLAQSVELTRNTYIKKGIEEVSPNG